jgi:dihydroorotate dehydrogenase
MAKAAGTSGGSARKAPLTIIGRLEETDQRPPIRIDMVGTAGVNKLKDAQAMITAAKTASVAVYIRGTPAEISAVLLNIAGQRFEQVNATLSLRGG